MEIKDIRTHFESFYKDNVRQTLSFKREVGTTGQLLGYINKKTRGRFKTFSDGFRAALMFVMDAKSKFVIAKLRAHKMGLGITTAPIPTLHPSLKTAAKEQARLAKKYPEESFVCLSVVGLTHGVQSPFKEATVENFFKHYTTIAEDTENATLVVLSDSAKEYDSVYGELCRAVIATISLRDTISVGALENFSIVKTVKTKEEVISSFENGEFDFFALTENGEYCLLKTINTTKIEDSVFQEYLEQIRAHTAERFTEYDFK